MRTILAWTVIGLLLVGCGPKKPKLEPPHVQIIELRMSRPGDTTAQPFEAELRIRNTSETTLPAHQVSVELWLDNSPAGRFDARVDLDIPALATERIEVSGQLTAEQADRLVAVERRGRQITYSLEGTIQPGESSFPVSYDGYLSRTPGKPGSFR